MTSTSTCPNCGCPAPQEYCPRCGQATRDVKLPLKSFAAEFIAELFSLDSRLATTIKPLFLKPGFIAAEYLAGRRARFVPPIRLYIFASFAMFLLMALNRAPIQVTTTVDGERTSITGGPSSQDSVTGDSTTNSDSERAENNGFAARMERGMERLESDPAAFRDTFLRRMAQAMFVLLPAFALLLKMVNPGRMYVEHLVHSVYFHCFAFIVIALLNIPAAVGLTRVSSVASSLYVTFPIYLLFGMRRMYGQPWLRTGVKFVILCFCYLVLLIATTLSVLLLTLLAG